MERLSAYEFANKIKTSPCWKLTLDNVTGEFEVIVRDHPTAEPILFRGPDPAAMNSMEHDWFIRIIEEITSAAMKRSSMMERAMRLDRADAPSEESDPPAP